MTDRSAEERASAAAAASEPGDAATAEPSSTAELPSPAVAASDALEPAGQPSPADDPLGPAIAAMDGGDLREARRLATALANDGDASPAARARASTLLGQLAPDRTIVAVMGLTGGLGVLLALLYFAGRLP